MTVAPPFLNVEELRKAAVKTSAQLLEDKIKNRVAVLQKNVDAAQKVLDQHAKIFDNFLNEVSNIFSESELKTYCYNSNL